MNSRKFPGKCRWLMAGLVILGTAAPALAQFYGDEDITVTGRFETAPDYVQSLSQRVSYADLDLGTSYGRRQLRYRVADAADFLCDRLGESDDSTIGVIPSCQSAAYDNAMRDVHDVEVGYVPRYAYSRSGRRYPFCSTSRDDDCIEG